jgi:catechol 2,3-dioxygenase-like lactoylglutathione lyase family enzyme
MATSTQTQDEIEQGPPELGVFSHVSVPCRDLAEGIRFYVEVLGGKLRVHEPAFASIRVAGTDIGIGAEGCSMIARSAEYPHFAFFAGPDEMRRMKRWLDRCGVPTTNFWTRGGVEALMFFRDPSGNLIEIYCERGFDGADQLPRGPARGHGIAIDIDQLYYDKWQVPVR